jgi:hypothetical protein
MKLDVRRGIVSVRRTTMTKQTLKDAVGRDPVLRNVADDFSVGFSKHNLQRVFAAVNSWRNGYSDVLRGAGRFFRFHHIKLSRKAAQVFPPLRPRRSINTHGFRHDDV